MRTVERSLKINWELLEKAKIVLFPDQIPKLSKRKSNRSGKRALRQRAAAGTCMWCGKPRDTIGRLCKKHREYNRVYQQKLRDEGRQP